MSLALHVAPTAMPICQSSHLPRGLSLNLATLPSCHVSSTPSWKVFNSGHHSETHSHVRSSRTTCHVAPPPSFTSRYDTFSCKIFSSSLKPEPWLKGRETKGRERGRERRPLFASEGDNNTSKDSEKESQEGGAMAGASKLDEGEKRGESGAMAVSGGEGEDAPKIGLALASAGAAVVLFFATRFGGGGVDLGSLAALATPYDEALSNGRPTVVEFYADWCEVCRELAKDVYGVEVEYRDKVNFVMLNIDNVKWAQELDEFGVEGIPHFVFLDGEGNEEGNIVGKLPRKYLLENVLALSQGEKTLPHFQVVGNFSVRGDREVPTVTDPRSHGK